MYSKAYIWSYVTQPGLKLTLWPKMIKTFQLTCLHLPSCWYYKYADCGENLNSLMQSSAGITYMSRVLYWHLLSGHTVGFQIPPGEGASFTLRDIGQRTKEDRGGKQGCPDYLSWVMGHLAQRLPVSRPFDMGSMLTRCSADIDKQNALQNCCYLDLHVQFADV